VQQTCRISLQNVRALQDHQKKERPQPQGTYADALLRTSHKRPPEGEKITASRYLRSRPTTYTSYMITRRRQDPRLEVHSLTPYYVHAIQDHQKKKRPQPQGTYAHALLRTRHTRSPEEDRTPASRYIRSRPTTYMPYKKTRRRKRFLPQGTYAHALLRTRYTRQPEEEKTPASRYLRSRPTTYTQSKTTARRTHPSLKVPTLVFDIRHGSTGEISEALFFFKSLQAKRLKRK
jgi:hypothetical protein